MVGGDRQGKAGILLNSLGNELQVEHRYFKRSALQLSGAGIGKCPVNMWVIFAYTETSLVQKSHRDAKLQCCSCYHSHTSVFSWQFCYSCGVVCDMDSKEFGLICYFIFLKV